MNKLYSEIEKILDYKFKDINLLDEALTHSSIKTNNKNKKVFNYERLEFLGDRILGFVISDLIFKKFPNFQEGDLSILFQKYTNTKFLSDVAISLNLNKFVIVQKGDALWNIAYQRLGLGNRYIDIVKLNKDKIKNPDLIYPKQLFIIPNKIN